MNMETRMPAALSARDDGRKAVVLAGGVDAAFGGALLALFRHDAGGMRPRRSAMASISSVAAISRLSGMAGAVVSRSISSSEICRRSSRRCAVMPSAPAACASHGGAHRIGIVAAPRIPHGGDMIDIDAEAERAHRHAPLLWKIPAATKQPTVRSNVTNIHGEATASTIIAIERPSGCFLPKAPADMRYRNLATME